MFITVCGWIFCVAVFVGLVILVIYGISESRLIDAYFKCDPAKNNGVCSRCAKGTWYGFKIQSTGERKISFKKLRINCVLCVLPIIWACIVIIFAI